MVKEGYCTTYPRELGLIASMIEASDAILRIHIIMVFDEAKSPKLSAVYMFRKAAKHLPFAMIRGRIDDRLAAVDFPKLLTVDFQHLV